jgi:hypothetical protein
MEFDPFGLSVKDLPTTRPPQASTHYALTIAVGSTSLWHRCLGHPGPDALLNLSTSSAITCNKPQDVQVCHA